MEAMKPSDIDVDTIQDNDTALAEEPGVAGAPRSPNDLTPRDEMGKSYESGMPILHRQLLRRAEDEQQANAASLERFHSLILEKISEINKQDKDGRTALYIAIQHGLKSEAQGLIRAGADVSMGNSEGQQPLHLACLEGQIELVRLILSKKPRINAITNGGETPIAAACRTGHSDIFRLLLLNEANTKTFDKNGWTPLHWASLGNHEEIVKLLLKKDASNIDATESNENWTPLNAAAYCGHKEIVSLLLRSGADHCIPDSSNWTPLMTATRMKFENVVEIILRHDSCCLETPDNSILTPIHIASINGSSRIVRMLLEAGAKHNATDSNGMTPLHFASGFGAGKAFLSEPDVYSNGLEGGDDPSMAKWREGIDLHQYSDVMKLLLETMKPKEFSCEHWRASPVYSALYGADPQSAMEVLLSDERMKRAPFWKAGGKIEVIKEAMRMVSPEDIISLIFRKLPVDKIGLPEGSDYWGPVEWAAYERLPDLLYDLVYRSQPLLNINGMVHEALHMTCNTISAKELETESLCKKVCKVMWILITASDWTHQNKSAVSQAYEKIRFWAARSFDSARSPMRHIQVHEYGRTGISQYDKGNDYPKVNKKSSTPEHGLYGKEKQPRCLGTLQAILRDPQFASSSPKSGDKYSYSLPIPRPDLKNILEETEATIVALFRNDFEASTITKSSSIQEVIYNAGPSSVIRTTIENIFDNTGDFVHTPISYEEFSRKENREFTWIHLPSTNMVWMNDLLTRIIGEEGYSTKECRNAISFFRDSCVEVPDHTSRFKMMRPQSIHTEPYVYYPKLEKGDSESDKYPPRLTSASAVYMPYLTYSTHCRDWKNISSAGFHNSSLRKTYEHYEKLLEMYQEKGKPQHRSPTLDEWYYQFAKTDNEAVGDQNFRNENQVLSKYLEEIRAKGGEGGNTTRIPNQWTIVRVNQLWVWTISSDWIITATSSPIGDNPDMLVEDILKSLSKKQEYGGINSLPSSADDLVPLIVDHCINSYERGPNDRSHLSIAQTFSHFVNRIGRNGTSLFQDLRVWSPDESVRKAGKQKTRRYHLGDDAASQDGSENPLATRTIDKSRIRDPDDEDVSMAIQTAKDLHCDIHDVRDEINILKSVAQYQQIVQRGLAGEHADDSRFSSTYVLKDLQELDSTAERIQSAINTTLAFQQSEVANRQATEATRQGKTVMTFTFVTVLFLPLSFLSSLFALDVASFQEAPAWAFYIIFFVSIGISVILWLGILYLEKISHVKNSLVDTATFAFDYLLKLILTSLLMTKHSVMSGEKRYGGSNILLDDEGREQRSFARFREQGRRDDVEAVENRGM